MRKANAKILVIDDDADVLTAAKIVLRQRFETVDTERNPQRIPALMERTAYDVVLLDMNFNAGRTAGSEGLYWLKQLRSARADLSVIMITAYGHINLAVEAMKHGASDFVVKPWENEQLEATVVAAFEKSVRSGARQQAPPERLANESEPLVLGESPSMMEVFRMMDRVAGTDANVLLLGENGTGKGLIAQELHRRSQRRNHPFVKVDVGSIPPTLFESELFGHKKGAFTDAREDRPGRMALANGGTLFLDEIGNLPLPQQVKLLSVLQNREVLPLGASDPVALDIRIITATNLDLHRAASQNIFREDLLYRINTVEIVVPPLRERAEDIPVLARHFLKRFAQRYDKAGLALDKNAMTALQHYRWPGNVRELEHTMERAVILTQGAVIGRGDLALSQPASVIDSEKASTLDELEREAIVKAIQKYKGNLSRVAKALGLGRTTLYRKMEKYGLAK